MTRLVAYALILLGILFFAHAAYDEDRGVAMASAPTRGGQTYIIRKDQDPGQFRNLMTYEWLRGAIVLAGGLILRGICRRADRLDPFSPDFAGNAALDELNKALTQEEERRKQPRP